MTSFSQLFSLHHNCHYCFFSSGLFTVLPPHELSACQSNLRTISRLIFLMGYLSATTWASHSLSNSVKSLRMTLKPPYHVLQPIYLSPTNFLSVTKTSVLLLSSHTYFAWFFSYCLFVIFKYQSFSLVNCIESIFSLSNL